MSKRKRSSDGDEAASRSWWPFKRSKLATDDALSRLSDELLIRVLSHLSVDDLIRCQGVSRRFDTLTTDSQLWKALYYYHFVRPRAARIPGISNSSLTYSSRTSNWLEDRHLLAHDAITNWKAQYRLRRNWTMGSPKTSGFWLSGHLPPVLPLIRMQGNHAVAIDPQHGLRAWTVKGHAALIASNTLPGKLVSSTCLQSLPTVLALNTRADQDWPIKAVVGYEDGSWSLHALENGRSQFTETYRGEPSSHGPIVAAAYSHPYLATLNKSNQLCVYDLPDADAGGNRGLSAPQLLCSLGSHTVQYPLSISLRNSPVGLIASIAFAVPSYRSGWTVGVQELHIAPEGESHQSRVATAPGIFSAAGESRGECEISATEDIGISPQSATSTEASRPSSLSYSHPYLLVSQPDNTLSVHLVRSTSSQLSVSGGYRLWGHTSSVSDAQVGDKGKAISASASGDELRVWDLESLVSSKKRHAASITGKSIQPHLDMALKQGRYQPPDRELRRDHRVVGFDQEKIVTMRETDERALIVYDFS